MIPCIGSKVRNREVWGHGLIRPSVNGCIGYECYSRGVLFKFVQYIQVLISLWMDLSLL